jgi:hypothetical protein
MAYPDYQEQKCFRCFNYVTDDASIYYKDGTIAHIDCWSFLENEQFDLSSTEKNSSHAINQGNQSVMQKQTSVKFNSKKQTTTTEIIIQQRSKKRRSKHHSAQSDTVQNTRILTLMPHGNSQSLPPKRKRRVRKRPRLFHGLYGDAQDHSFTTQTTFISVV